MKAPYTLLIKVFCIGFYRHYTSLFLLVVAFAGGFLRGDDHVFLARYFTSSPLLLLVPCALWTIYSLLLVEYNSRVASQPQNSFVAEFILFPSPVQRKFSLLVAHTQLIPVWLYAAFLELIAIHMGHAWSASLIPAVILLLHVVLTLTLVAVLNRRLTTPGDTNRLFRFSKKLPNVRWPVPRTTVLLPVEWAIRSQLLTITAFKLLGMLLLAGTLLLYEKTDYDSRLLAFSACFAFSFSLPFAICWHHFDNTAFRFTRGLPVTMLQRLRNIFLTAFVFALPELIILMGRLPESVTRADGLGIGFFGISMVSLGYAFLYLSSGSSEQKIRIVFFYVLLLSLLVLGHVPVLLLGALNSALAVVVFSYRFYRHESAPDEAGSEG